MISVENISVKFGGFNLFENVSFMISPKDRIGLVGKNGAGKSTLLKIILGLQKTDSGSVEKPNDIKIGYLPQHMNISDNTTVWDETELAFEEIKQLESKIQILTDKLNERTDYNSEEYQKIVEDLSFINERYVIVGGQNYHADIEKTLLGLGFVQSDFKRQTSELSGGWRMRIELAKILLSKPDVLLLDEPTNHLDIESIQWLEEYLQDFSGAVVLISHDRTFLDNVTSRTIEISMGKIFDYRVPYSKFVTLRQERREQQLAAYKNQQKMIKDTERFIERFRYKNTKSVQVQSRIKMLEKLDIIEIDDIDTKTMHFRFPPAPSSGNPVIVIKNLSKSYDNLQVLQNIDLTIEKGEKIAFVGKNGEGKTTLSKIIAGELDYTGNFKLGHNVKIGYYAQNEEQLLDENKTVFETIDDIAVGDVRQKIRDILGAFLFSGEDVDKKVKVLSGGERSRLAMVKLILQPVNLLVLDEPTNHLDMLAKDVLKSALMKYDGTLIIVSHDRYFLDGLVDKVYEFRNTKIKEYIGGIFDFLKKRKLENLEQLNNSVKSNINKAVKKESENKLNYIAKKEQEKIIRRIKNQISKTEQKIAEIEQKIAEMDEIFANPANYNIQSITQDMYDEYKKYQKDLENLLNDWENYNVELENQTNNKNE
ncbi:MAG: ABC-F family ATP-binding cassette domain-containing protein [Marinilabiliales bacterium]